MTYQHNQPGGDMRADNPAGLSELLAHARVGIAGCGGIGSNVAVALARAGVGSLTLADRDFVELRNLNRQHYFVSDVGSLKVRALAGILGRIDPSVRVWPVAEEIDEESAVRLFAHCDLLVEALDEAAAKQMLLESWAEGLPLTPIVACSGIAGYGASDSLGVRRLAGLTVVGDGATSLSLGTTAPRVGAVAMLMANEAVETLARRLG